MIIPAAPPNRNFVFFLIFLKISNNSKTYELKTNAKQIIIQQIEVMNLTEEIIKLKSIIHSNQVDKLNSKLFAIYNERYNDFIHRM